METSAVGAAYSDPIGDRHLVRLSAVDHYWLQFPTLASCGTPEAFASLPYAMEILDESGPCITFPQVARPLNFNSHLSLFFSSQNSVSPRSL